MFVQLGTAFEPLRAEICDQLRGVCVSVDGRQLWSEQAKDAQTIIVTDLEQCVQSDLLGEVREIVLSLLDANKMVCLISRAPRIAFRSVPGSSVLEDAALVTLPLLERSEVETEPGERVPPGWPWPVVSFSAPLDVETFRNALDELGQGVVAALDHALFEVNPKGEEGLEFLATREIEGLRGSGIVEIDSSGKPILAIRGAKMLREALASQVSETVTPATTLPEVTSGLWYIERTIRSALRSSAITRFGDAWRASAAGGLKDEILKRAQLDTNVSAKTMADLRDPLEWLTLGELMDVVRSTKFDNLGIEPAIWRKLQEQLVPIRNRLAHVRMLKSEDAEIVTMWASMVKSRFGR